LRLGFFGFRFDDGRHSPHLRFDVLPESAGHGCQDRGSRYSLRRTWFSSPTESSHEYFQYELYVPGSSEPHHSAM
jgi:hypothetical protein